MGNFIRELKFCCDWYAMHLAGFRYGICHVPERLAVFHVQPKSYYHRIRRNPLEYRKVLEELLRRLSQPENQDAVELMRQGGSLFIFAMPMLKMMLFRPEYRRFLTPTFLRKNLAHSVKLFLKNHAPARLVNAYVKFSGYRTRAVDAKT